jgi:glycosyltransferase involved in cell wall biosynthesis
MKKILFAVTTDLNYDQRMQRICTSLAGSGYAVEIVGRKWPVSKPLQKQPYQQHRLQCFFHKGKLFYLEYNLRLFFYLIFKRADAFSAADPDAALPMLFKSKLAGKPFIFDAHEYFSEVPEVVHRPRIRKMWQKVERFIIPRAALRYTVTQTLAETMEQDFGYPFEVIRNLTVLKPLAIPEKPRQYVLYQGATNAGRGLEMLLDVMPEIDAELWICGQGDILEDLKARAEKLQLKKVKFLGYVLPEELEKITLHAYIGVNLLENRGRSYYFSLANKFFDYLHAGIPQVVINFPEYEKLNQQYHVGVTIPLEKEALKTALNELLTNKDRYSGFVKNCLVAREELNWQTEEKKLLALYKNLWPSPKNS